MLHWLVDALRTHPELALFLVLGVGYALGRVRIGSFQLGTVIGVLIAGILIGQLRIEVPAALKDTFFLLFLFSIGFKTGPQFFSGLRSGGLAQAVVTVVVCVTGLLAAFVAARLFGFDAGTASGLVAGAMTESATLGTAGDAIDKLLIDADLREQLATGSTVAFAVTYVVGMISVTWLLPRVGPWLMRVDLAESCRKLETELGIDQPDPGVSSAHADFVMRAYDVSPEYIGKSARDLEGAFGAFRVYCERVRRNRKVESVDDDFVLQEGDRVVLAGRSEALVGETNPLREHEVDDRELLDIPTVQIDVIVTNRNVMRTRCTKWHGMQHRAASSCIGSFAAAKSCRSAC